MSTPSRVKFTEFVFDDQVSTKTMIRLIQMFIQLSS